MSLEPQIQIATPPTGTWVQTERAAHERWSILAVEKPRAAALLHVIIAKMGRHNALVASQETLSNLTKCSTRTVRRSLQVLKEENWIEIRQVGASGTVNAYIVNDRVAWSGARDGIRYSLFSAAVLVSDNEQPDNADIGMQPPLEHIPSLQPGERQLPTGPGMPPPSQPSLDGLEPDLPTTSRDDPAQ
ncbi:replication/maintenance protein RepL [Gluconobacter cerinus]|uniref:helix-turn-helix domain-containing protein n=1 Tax=Gluconobacter cerinus TaxID=38307 RepID=UPI001B8AA8F0|nr:helix-turn-helix domain-containing protein [Gluconobacter cerinus]MBS1020404.1 replication/maintenance protein RepL [Gluconobacter cerinus]